MEALAIGCFLFSRKGGAPEAEENFRPTEHLKEIKNALEAIDNVSNVETWHPASSISISGHSYSDDDVEEDENFYPIFGKAIISFDIFMPHRLIEKHSLGRSFNEEIEYFHVDIVHDGRMPVTYVTYETDVPLTDAKSFSPSNAIIFIREYLKEKLKEHPTIHFCTLGPTPFHADFFIEEMDQQSASVRDLTDWHRGYRCYHVEVPKSDNFLANYHEVISVFYQLMRVRNASLRLNSIVVNGTRQLITESRKGGLRGLFTWFTLGGLIDAVTRSMLEEKLNTLNRSEILAEIRKSKSWDDTNLLCQYIVSDTNDIPPSPAEEVKQILKFMEDRRQGYIRNGTTVLSGLIGGILGATLTFLLGQTNKSEVAKPALTNEVTTGAKSTLPPSSDRKSN